MTATVTFLDEAALVAEVRIAPGLVGRLLGRPARELRAVQGAGGCWLDDVTGRLVRDRAVTDAIDREQAAAVGARRRAAIRQRT